MKKGKKTLTQHSDFACTVNKVVVVPPPHPNPHLKVSTARKAMHDVFFKSEGKISKRKRAKY